MKKFVNPEITVEEMAVCDIIATSNLGGGSANEGGDTPGD